MATADLLGMDCDDARTWISARADGELDPGDSTSLDQHLQSCPSCLAWEGRVYALRRTLVMRQGVPPADLADRVLANLNVPNTGAGQWVRYVLGVVAATIVALNLPLLLGVYQGGANHETRHLGTFGVALGVGLLWAALKPERAVGLVPLAVALAAATLVGTVVDIATGRTAAVTESHHILELGGLVLLWYLADGMTRFRHHLRGPRLHHRPA